MKRLLPLLILLLSFQAFAQTTRVTGKVTSAVDNTGLPGVNVVIKGTTIGTITDIEGNYAMDVPTNATLVYSYIGFKSQEIVYTGQTSIMVSLEEDAKILGDEVVVVGYQSVEKRTITGAVTTVKVSNLKDLAVNGIDQALQGQAPGVQVTQSSGTPGGGVNVRIRGATSISAANAPLYIVDGIQVATGTLSGRDFGGQNDNALSLINPADIESLTILKDASAKALYGARASNGVVVITTRRGKSGKSTIQMDVQRGITDPTHTLDLLNSKELLTLQREAVTNAGLNPDALGLIPGVTDAVDTDWQKAVLRTGIMQQYQLTASGGDEKTTFYLSTNYRDEQGVQLNNEFSRIAATLNFDHKASERLKISTNLTISRSFNKRVKGDNFLDGVFSGAVKSLPYYTPYDENGKLVGPGSSLYAAFPNFNPVAQALLPRFNVTTVKILGGVNATYKINSEFSLRGQFSVDHNDVTEDNWESSQTAIGGYLPSIGGKGLSLFIASGITTLTSYGTLNYSKDIGKGHLTALAGMEVLQNFSSGGNVQGRLFTSDDFSYINSAGLVDQGGSYRDPQHGIVSFLSQADYDIEERLMFGVSMRADGSSNFGANYRYGYFPAVSAGWRISQEKFFNSKVINDLKIRGSFGYTGNERIGAFTFLGLWNASTYAGSSGVSPGSIDNPDIRWETTREFNLGVDIALLESRIQTTVEAYTNKTTNLLLTRPYALTTGFGGVFSNIGSLGNKGIELTINSVNLDGAIKWRSTVNLSKNLNKVLALVDTLPLYRGYQAEGVDGTNIINVGQPLGTFYGLNYLGVNPATGDAMYEDRNGDGLINNSDAKIIGNAQPKFIGGVTNTFAYRNFDLSFLFNFSVGNKILNFTKSTLVNMGTDIQNNQLREALRRWQKPGDITDIPRYQYQNSSNNLHSNRLLEDGSYIRLKNVSFGYNLPPKYISRFKITNIRLYVTATNLWTLTKYTGSDPEVSTLDGSTSAQGIDFFTLPQVRTIAAGINVKF